MEKLGFAFLPLFLVFGLAQIGLGVIGIQSEFGGWWAFGALVAAFGLRIMLPLTIGTYFGVVNVLGWPWWAGVLIAAPGLLFLLPSVIADVVEGFTASNSEQASAKKIGKTDNKLESSKQQKSIELDQSMPLKVLFGFILVFAFLLVFYAKMEPASSRMPAPTGAPSLPTDSASAIESPTVSPQQTEPNETHERVHVATYSSEPYGANIIIDGWDYGRGPVTIRYTVPPDLADGDKLQLPGGYAIWLDGSRSPTYSYFLTEVSPSNGSNFVFQQQVRTLPRAGQPEQPVTPDVSGVEPAGSKPADSSASAATAEAATTAQAGFVPSSGIWTGLGRDEGSDWEIIIKVTNANYVGQNVGISSYQDTVRFFGPCLCTLELISIEMDRIVLRERKNSPLSRECIFSPAGKDITLINVNGDWSGTWRKRSSGNRVTMFSYLQYAP